MSVTPLRTRAVLRSTTAYIGDLNVVDLALTLDEGSAPWASADMTVSVDSEQQYAMLEPGAPYRVSIIPDSAIVSTTSYWELRVQQRRRTPLGLVDLALVGPDQDLLDYTPSAPIKYWTKQADALSIIPAVLTQAYGSDNAWSRLVDSLPTVGEENLGTPTYRTYSEATNLVANGSFEYGTSGWTATRGSIRTQSWSGGLAPNMGTTTLRVEGSGTNNDTFAATPVTLQPSTTYTVSGWMLNGSPQTSAHARARSLCIVATVAGTAFVLAQTPQGSNSANGISRVSSTFTTPAMMDSSGASLRAYNGTTSGASNAVLWDGLMIVEGDGLDTDGVTPIPYIDGDTTDGTAGYNYDWQGDVGNSSSRRTPIADRVGVAVGDGRSPG